MSSSVKPATQSKASNPSVPLANSAWSKGPPQTAAASNSSRAQSPASNAPPGTHSRRQSTLGPNAGQGAVKPVTIGRGITGAGHRPTNSISFGSVDATPVPATAPAPAPATPIEKAKQPDPVLAAPSPSIAVPQPPAPASASAPAPVATPAQPPAQAPEPAPAPAKANGIKVVAPTPTQPAPASKTPATTTPSAASTPPASTSTPKPKKALNVHALFQGGGVTSVPPVVAPQAPASAPVQPPAPSAPTGPNAPRGPGFPGRDAVPFPRSPQIPRPPLAGTQSGSGGPRPAGSPRMGGASMPLPHHQQHHPQHAPHMQPQWGQPPYYYQPQGFDPYMHHYWSQQQQHHPHSPHPHQHPHIPPHIHNAPMQSSPRLPAAQPRPPSTPPVSTTSPHPPAPGHAPPPISTHVHNPTTPSVPSPATGSQLNTAAAAFVPGGSMMRPRAQIRISTPDGSALSFEGTVPPSPKVSIGVGQGAGPPVSLPKRSAAVRLESAEDKSARLAREKEEKEKKEREEREKKEEKERLEREAKEKEEKEREEKVRKEREEIEAKERAEREERERVEREAREKEERERKEQEEKERLEREERERVERDKAEAEAKAKAEEEARIKAEVEARAKAEAEAKAKEEAEAKARAEAEAAAAAAAAEAKAKEEAEAAAKAKAEAEEKARAEAEAEAKAKAEADAAAAEARDTVSPVESPKPTSNGLLPSTIPERPSPLSISTTANERPKRPVPGPLDLSSAQGNRSAAPPSALASARIIEDLNAVPYPETIRTPNPDLNIAATPGKFRYDRDFLLQFMNVCKEKPDSLPPLDAIGLEPGDQSAANYAGGVRQDRRRVGSMGMSSAPGIQRQGSIGLGLGNVPLPKGAFTMGSFQAPLSRHGDGNTVPGRGAPGIPFPPGTANRLTTPMTRSTSHGGVGGAGGPREAKRTRSQRGSNRGDSMRASGYQTPSNQMMASFEPVVPLEQSENRWVAGSIQRTPQQIEARALVDRKVKSLLNKLTMEKFDSISDQIIEFANKSEQEKDGSTLMQVIKLIFEKAKDEAGFSEMYARLCRKMMERVSPNVQDETIRNAEGQPITGGLLFRKYLLNRCQEDFERGWSAKEAAAALAASKAGDDKAAEAAGQANGEAVLYSEEYYAAAKAKRQGLGLVRFIGELFKLQMLTERIMHECIKKLLSNVVNPEEEEIESLCKLLTTVGHSLDNAKARNHMDIYFERMQEMARGNNINSRMQFMLQDVIELRHRHWQARSAVAQPSTLAAVHEQAKRDEAASRNAIQRGGSRRGEHRNDHGQQADGWNVAGGTSAARPPAKAGDLSQFGKISKPTGLSFGPTSVFNKGPKQRDASLSRASSNVNMFAALGAAGADGPPQPETAARGGASSRKPSMDLGSGGAPAVEGGNVRRRLNLLPRTKPTETDADKGEDEATPETTAAPTPMSEADAQKKVKEDIKEYLGVENVEEAILALETLPIEHRHIFVDKMVGAAFDGGNKVVVLAEKLFAAIHKQQACSAEAFERGLLLTVEMADDMSIDVPKTYEWLARLMCAAGIDRTKAEELAGKISVIGEPRIQPSDLLMQEFDKALA
ncbi:hypothetical protein FRC10_008613 [Ceratobasidium sp. 414]|nr:hypothetical protein FRC10_008613 [Ceratobasidium sp. 414]